MDTAFTFSFTLEFGKIFGVTGKGDFDGKCISVAGNHFSLQKKGEREAAEEFFSSHEIDWEIFPIKGDNNILIKVVEFKESKCQSAHECNMFVRRVMLEVATKGYQLHTTGKLDNTQPEPSIPQDMMTIIRNAVDMYVYELM